MARAVETARARLEVWEVIRAGVTWYSVQLWVGQGIPWTGRADTFVAAEALGRDEAFRRGLRVVEVFRGVDQPS
jgi:hypothetical protein